MMDYTGMKASTERAAESARDILREDGSGFSLVLCFDYRNPRDVQVSVRGDEPMNEIAQLTLHAFKTIARENPPVVQLNPVMGGVRHLRA